MEMTRELIEYLRPNKIDELQEEMSIKYYGKGYYEHKSDATRAVLTQSVAHEYAKYRLKQASELAFNKGQYELSKQILEILKD